MEATVIARLRFMHRKAVVPVSCVVLEEELLRSVSIRTREKTGPAGNIVQSHDLFPVRGIKRGHRVVVRTSERNDPWIAFRGVAGRQHSDACNGRSDGDARHLLAVK